MIQSAPQISIYTPAVSSAPAINPRRSGGVREFVAYFGASAAALTLDTALFRVGLGAGMPLGWAAALGFTAGLLLVYVLCSRFVFRERRLKSSTAEFALFATIGVLGLGVTEGLLWWTVGWLEWAPVVAKLATACAVFVFNFTVRKLMLFTANKVTEHA